MASEVRGTKKRWLMQQRGREESRTSVEGRSHVRHIDMEDLRFAPGSTHTRYWPPPCQDFRIGLKFYLARLSLRPSSATPSYRSNNFGGMQILWNNDTRSPSAA